MFVADCLLEAAKTWRVAGREFQKENDVYFFNSCWFVTTSMMPGGGGNVLAASHFGRLIGASFVI